MTTYSESGVVASQTTKNEKNNLSISYEGLLYKAGAETVYAHYGYGAKWTNLDTLKMTRTEKGFKIDIPLAKTGTINVAFKDNSENWDNNLGSNYSFSLRAKKK